jgi:hypothetical protein
MKQFYPIQKEKNSFTKKAVLSIAFAFIGLVSFSQNLTFKNPVLISGKSGADGAIYRFPNVATNMDALVTITQRSSCLVNLDALDVTSIGYDMAFQPKVSYNNGQVSGAANWWMEFQITFVQAGTTLALLQDSINAKSLSIDGDGSALQDQFTAIKSSRCTTSNPTSIQMASTTDGDVLTGPVTNYPTIDSTTTQIMAFSQYVGTCSIKFRYGAIVKGSMCHSEATSRINSILFSAFSHGHTLPMQLVSFATQYDNNAGKAILNWSTTTEIYASHFVVQRSEDGVNYDDVALVFTQEGNSNSLRDYSYTDNVSSIKSRLVYYRLQMVDVDGAYAFSNINVIRLENQDLGTVIKVFPNPVQGQLQISVPNSWQGKMVYYVIYNSNGALVKQITNSNAGQTETVNVADLPMGVYIVKAANGNETSVQRIVKVN